MKYIVAFDIGNQTFYHIHYGGTKTTRYSKNINDAKILTNKTATTNVKTNIELSKTPRTYMEFVYDFVVDGTTYNLKDAVDIRHLPVEVQITIVKE